MNHDHEMEWDKLLKIRSGGRDDSKADQYHYPYEPTPYTVLERLANEGMITKKNCVLDYGCGKGRVGLFLSYQTRCRSIGVEFDERIYRTACENKNTAVSGARAEFVPAKAQEYIVPAAVDRVFFFNPFSLEILQKVIAKVIDSYYCEPRKIYLYFYYPSEEYISYLMTVDEVTYRDEIDCRDLFPGDNQREKIMIFEMG